MFSNHQWRKPFMVAISILILAILLIAGTHFAYANKGQADLKPDTSNNPTGYGDDGIFEVGVEWINDFPGTADDRSHWDESCDGLYNQLLNQGWTSRFHWTDWNAYETDFKNESLGGHEDTYADSADIAMICTHGAGTYDSFWGKNLSSVYFGSTHDDQHLSPGEAYRAYGDKDLEWLAFDSCSVLSDGGASPYFNRGYWSTTMNGLHLLLGFKNTMYVSLPGDGLLWGYYMNGVYLPFFGWILPPFTVLQSWFTAVDYVQPTVTCARVLAEVSNNYNDHLWGKGYVSPDPATDGYYWYWDHCSSGAKLANTENEQPDIFSIPVYKVMPRNVNEDYVRNRIAYAFDMTGDIFEDDMFYYMISQGEITKTLQVDKINGSFNFRNIGRLWVPPSMPPVLPDPERANAFLSNWFKSNGEGLPGIWQYQLGNGFYEVEQMVEMQIMQGENGELQEQQVASIPTDVVMTYPRIIPTTAQTANGPQQLELPLFGPGGRLKIYLGGMDEIDGLLGGSRDVQNTGEMVNILDPNLIWEMFMADHSLAIPETPWIGDTITFTTVTLGYYENSYLQNQDVLIPVWNFNANYFAKGVLVAENVDVYLPAAEEFMPPQVNIISPNDGATFRAGEPILFEGSASGGTPPYSYEWTSSSDGTLGNSLNILSSLGSEVKGGSVFQPTVSLQVTDANGFSATDTIILNINPVYWMPVIKN
jgi:hypothetical protein